MSIPGSANPLLLASAAGATGYNIERSLRFNSADSAYLSRTPASAGNRKTWTWAGWVKKCSIDSSVGRGLFSADLTSTSDSNFFELRFGTGAYPNSLAVGGYNTNWRITTQVFRDASAWYHIVLAVDTTQATGADRIKIYVNGVQITSFVTSSDPTQNTDLGINNTTLHNIGKGYYDYLSGYLADIHFIDGQALDPTSFTEVDATTGQLIPKAYTGTYGTNGFHLPFSNNSTAAALGTDTSGNGNTWTVNNISVAAGAGNDSLVDVPTASGTDTGAGGTVRGNYCTWNPLINGDTAANGNLDVTNDTARGTQKLLEYDAYWEITSTGGTTTAGIVSDGGTTNTTTVADGKTYGFKLSAAGSLEYINITDGGSFTSITTGLTGIQFPYASAASATTGSLNAGQRPFAATAPSGFKALCTTNLPDPVVAQPSTVMDVALWTGNATARSITGFNFSPDFVWIKNRADSSAGDHRLFDTVRGATKELYSNLTNAEATETGGLTAFNSDGFSLGTINAVNGNADGIVGWAWDAGSSTVTNTQGSITSSVRANASAGFSIVTYTGNGTNNATVGHGLGVTPSMVIVKSRSATGEWVVSHVGLASSNVIWLNFTYAQTAVTSSAFGGPADLTSMTFKLVNGSTSGSNVNTNTTTYVAYCFAPVAGYSSFGSYTGNGSTDGPFVYTGFRPRWILIKNASSAVDWELVDTARDTSNGPQNNRLQPNSSTAEAAGYTLLDTLSNGFKIRNSAANWNGNANTIIYAAFADSPFKTARAR